jgi:hypothetical protein
MLILCALVGVIINIDCLFFILVELKVKGGRHHDCINELIKRFVHQAQLLLLYARLHISTLTIGHLQAFLQLSLQMLCMLGSQHVYMNKKHKSLCQSIYKFEWVMLLCYYAIRMALKTEDFKTI